MRRTLTDIFHYDLGSVPPLNPLVQLVVKHDLTQKLPNKLKCVDEILQSQSAPPTVPVCGELIDLLLHLEKNVSVALYTMLSNIYTFVIVASFFFLWVHWVVIVYGTFWCGSKHVVCLRVLWRTGILSRVYPASSPPLFKCEDAWMFVESVQLTELTCEHKLNFLKIKQQNEVKLSRALVIS